MTWTVVHLNDVMPSPWRNGGGTTRELIAWPEATAWLWRTSVAEVAQSGLFSSFVGVQRWFAVLEGDGVCLTVDNCLHMLTHGDPPLAFDGAAITSCELLGGATQDFNLMVKNGTSARMQRVRGSFRMMSITPKIIAAYANKKEVSVQIGSDIHPLTSQSFGWAHVDANTAVHVQASDALLMEIDT
jgi:environmental stress-induced protein Ves